jgi:hypothetical protein
MNLQQLIFASKNFRQTQKIGAQKYFRQLKFSPTPISDTCGVFSKIFAKKGVGENFGENFMWRKFALLFYSAVGPVDSMRK